MAIHTTAANTSPCILCIMFGILYMFAEHKIFSFHNINTTRVEQILNWQTHIQSHPAEKTIHIHSRSNIANFYFARHSITCICMICSLLSIYCMMLNTRGARARSLKIHFNIFAWEYKIFFIILFQRIVCVRCVYVSLLWQYFLLKIWWDDNVICTLHYEGSYNQIKCKEIIM